MNKKIYILIILLFTKCNFENNFRAKKNNNIEESNKKNIDSFIEIDNPSVLIFDFTKNSEINEDCINFCDSLNWPYTTVKVDPFQNTKDILKNLKSCFPDQVMIQEYYDSVIFYISVDIELFSKIKFLNENVFIDYILKEKIIPKKPVFIFYEFRHYDFANSDFKGISKFPDINNLYFIVSKGKNLLYFLKKNADSSKYFIKTTKLYNPTKFYYPKNTITNTRFIEAYIRFNSNKHTSNLFRELISIIQLFLFKVDIFSNLNKDLVLAPNHKSVPIDLLPF